MRPKILLVTTVQWPSAARLAGAFSHLGARVEAIFPKQHPLRQCRYLDRAYRYKPLSGSASIARAISASKPDRVIPCDDRALALLLRLKEFGPLLERSMGPLAGYETMTARAPSIAAARREGITAPLTLAVPDRDFLPLALAEIGFPCVMKADGSWGGGGVKFVTNFAEAERAFASLQGPPSRLRSVIRSVLRHDSHFLLEARHPAKAHVSVQALVEGKPATSVFAARDGKVLAALHMDVLSWSGETGPASLLARIDNPAMDLAAERLAARFGLNGLIGLDFMRDKDGVPHLIEINPRATQICHLTFAGIDLPAALLDASPRDPIATGPQVALFPQLLSAGALPKGVYRDIPWDDPGVLRLSAGEALLEAEELGIIAEFARSGGGAPILRKSV